jgi:NADPH:quinone reductase-like Zn-dependent oxidoreductase
MDNAASSLRIAPTNTNTSMNGTDGVRVVITGPSCHSIIPQHKPARLPGHLLIKTAFAGLNPTDIKHLAAGRGYYYGQLATPSAPVNFGSEGSGTVLETDEVGSFPVGSPVLFIVDKMRTTSRPSDIPVDGSLATYVNVPKEHCGALVSTLDDQPMTSEAVARATSEAMARAGGTPLALVTAYQMFRDGGFKHYGSGTNKTVLIHGGAGGVGHFAIQLARIYGFDSISTTCSKSNFEFCADLGADECIDYRVDDFADLGKKWSVVFDCIGGDPKCPCCDMCDSGVNRRLSPTTYTNRSLA